MSSKAPKRMFVEHTQAPPEPTIEGGDAPLYKTEQVESEGEALRESFRQVARRLDITVNGVGPDEDNEATEADA